MPPGLDVRTTHEDRTTTVVVVGEVDLLTSVRLNRELQIAFEAEPEWLRIDLSEVAFMDTTGVAVLLKARRQALEAGCRFTVKAASPTIQRLLEITGLATLLGE
ncbi:STAS domain-containing protein [Solirubrobacter sp. CPCC 204708]|uniref:Anti-sigma factor antagonist n=1 Tax=Solirubrobacter deserti TaxID=2282478 RepID=A0ABT4RE57_9ACTN|nr:STAS domain-containing protein [Solirubrobacter deserti]MBE2316046.1 STAS domain-containing protein [Solirubrobacter deserti]MDA0136798.1 STAS domain-containing protein [Solirubrobacter deserti]